MGNKNSKSTKAEKPNSKVRMREKKHAGVKRPMSEPVTDSATIDFSQFVFKNAKRPESKDISGKGVTGVSEDIPAADYEQPVSDVRPTGAQLAIFENALEQVLVLWPEYSPVKEITTQELPSPVIDTLTMIATRLYDQYNILKTLSEDVHELKQINSELQEERDAKAQLVRRREGERNGLREDVMLLRGELKRRGLEVKLPPRPSQSRDDVFVFDDDVITPRSDRSNERDDERQKKKDKGGIYSPTPIILAEGGNSREALQRHASLRSTPAQNVKVESSGAVDDQWAWSETNAPDELKQKLKMLQIALERERKEKLLLKERLETNSPGSKRSAHKGMSEIYEDEFLDCYRRLQREAFDRVRRQVTHNLPHVNTNKQLAFICSIMQLSYHVAKERVMAFMSNIEVILLNPTKPSTERHRNEQKPTRSGSILDNVRHIELARRDGLNRQYGQRSSTGRLPTELITRVTSFIEDSADVTSIAPLTSAVVDELQTKYPECTTPTLLNHPTFTSFLHGTCRLAWRINVVNPPYHVSTDATRFETRYHETDSSVQEIGQDIDFFLWPTLFCRKHGDVLNKGIVQLK